MGIFDQKKNLITTIFSHPLVPLKQFPSHVLSDLNRIKNDITYDIKNIVQKVKCF